MLLNNSIALIVLLFSAVWSRQRRLIIRCPWFLVSVGVSWSKSSCSRCQFEGIWKVALSNSRIAYVFQMGFRHPSTMPIRKSCTFYPIWKEENNPTLNKLQSWKLSLLMSRSNFTMYNQAMLRRMLLQSNDGEGNMVVLRSLLCWCTRIISAFSNDSSSGCWATKARMHCIWGKSVYGQK